MRRAVLTAIAICAFVTATLRAGASELPPPVPTPSALATPVTTFEMGASSQNLSGGHGSWSGSYLSAIRTSAPRDVAYFSVAEDRRFDSRDVTYTAGTYAPTSPNTILNFELSFSPTHRALPHDALGLSLDHRLAGGWGYTLGAQMRSYDAGDVETGSVLVDRYWKTFRAAYRITSTRLSSAPGIALAQSALLTRYYGLDGASSVTLAISGGREVDDLENGVHISTVTGVTLNGVHWIAPHWAATWSLNSVRQGSLYTRTGVQLGVRARL